jgi:hypothetical protein
MQHIMVVRHQDRGDPLLMCLAGEQRHDLLAALPV